MSFEDLGLKNNNARAKLLAKTLDAATGKLLDNNKGPSPERLASSTTAAASSTCRCTGRRSWPHKPKMPNWQPSLLPWPTTGRQRAKIVDELNAVQASLPTSVVTTARHRQAGCGDAPQHPPLITRWQSLA